MSGTNGGPEKSGPLLDFLLGSEYAGGAAHMFWNGIPWLQKLKLLIGAG
jgi:hypothetical protein